MIKKIKQYFHSQTDAQIALFQVLFGGGFLVLIGCLILSFFLRLSLNSSLGIFIGAMLVGLFWVIGNRFRCYDTCAFVAMLILNLILFPITFFQSGGVYSASPIWLVLGVIALFFVLQGKRLMIVFILSVLTDAGCFLVSYLKPQWVTPVGDEAAIFRDIALGYVVLILIVASLICFLRGVYDRERQRNERQQVELESALQTQSRFLANMSHEIRTPINTIIGLNEMTLREDISDEVAENAVNIQRASKMLLTLINDILDLSKIESGKMEIIPVQYETSALFSEIVNLNWVRAHEKNLEFRISVSPQLPSMLYGDEVRIKQIITNLMTNAIKYTQKGSVTLVADCERVAMNRVRLKISVSDTGIGIRQDDMQKLFDSFKRVDEKRNRGVEGTGLGLSICKQLVTLMGGQIYVDSIYQRGSTFTAEFEQEIIKDDPIGEIHYEKIGAKRSNEYQQSFEAPQARVLVVDDNKMNLLVAKKLLRKTRVIVDTASSGRECLELTEKNAYHVIFMDHLMPEMDGVQTLEAVRKQINGFCQNIPVIALTANAMSGAKEQYRKLGFQDYLAKPINAALFEAVLMHYLPQELIEYENVSSAQSSKEGFRVIGEENKRKIVITTDTVCDLPKEFYMEYDIPYMYYYVETEKGRFRDTQEIQPDNLLEYIQETGTIAKSEPPTVEEYEKFFGDTLATAEKIIHISMAKDASQGYARACKAAQGFGHVTVVNSGHLSNGMGILVLHAVQLVLDGMTDVDEIVADLKRYRKRISTSFIVAHSDNLYRGGRMNKTVYQLTELLNVHPVLVMKKNGIHAGELLMSDVEKAYIRYIRKKLKGKKNIDTRRLCMVHAGCSPALRARILEEVAKYQKFDQIITPKASAAITSNCGEGCFGLMFVKKER